MTYDWSTDVPGVSSLHAGTCPARDGLDCDCGPKGYRASFRDPTSGERTVSSKFRTVSEAVRWQRDQAGYPDRSHSVAEPPQLARLIGEFIEAAEAEVVRDARGQSYTQEGLRDLRDALSHVDAELGTMAAQDVLPSHVHGLVARLQSAGVYPTRVSALVVALHSVYAYAARSQLVDANPVHMPWSPAPFVAPAYPQSAAYPQSPVYPPLPSLPQASNGFPTNGFSTNGLGIPGPAVPSQTYNNQSGPLSGMLGVPDAAAAQGAASANYDATMQERMLWWTVRIVVIVFVLIALVLAAESV